MDAQTFLSRLPKHSRTDSIAAAVAECIKVANDFAAAKASLKAGDRLTSRGVNDALIDALTGYAARLAAARKPIDTLAVEAKTRRAAMKPLPRAVRFGIGSCPYGNPHVAALAGSAGADECS